VSAVSSTEELLRKVPFLAVLSDQDRETLAAAVKQHQYDRGRALFLKDDPGRSLLIIQAGSVRIYLPGQQGGDLTVALLQPGDFFGELALLDGGPRSASAVATEDTAILTLDRDDFLALLQTRPQAAKEVLAAVAQRLRDADEMANDLVFLDVAARLAKRLVEMARTHGTPRGERVLIDLPLTQEELASTVGVTRESVNRQLAAFRREGIIETKGRNRFLVDVEALQRYVV
jgi:CRP-like cAMP-binding protein